MIFLEKNIQNNHNEKLDLDVLEYLPEFSTGRNNFRIMRIDGSE
jgi:hypothetical protein